MVCSSAGRSPGRLPGATRPRSAARRSPPRPPGLRRGSRRPSPCRPSAPTAQPAARRTVYVRGARIAAIEGDADSPISRGRLCPKGQATYQLVTSSNRLDRVRYRRPGGTGWETLDLDTAIDMVVDRMLRTRDENLGSRGRSRAAAQSHPRHGAPGRRDARQRGVLPAAQARHVAGHGDGGPRGSRPAGAPP